MYKTTDGGKTWKQVLKVDDDTGANDLVMDPTNSQILYASTYQRRRTACCMNGGGPGSGIWKSTDGGETWTRIKGGVLDQPLGRIALDVYRKRPNILYAMIEGPAAAAPAVADAAMPRRLKKGPAQQAAGAAGGRCRTPGRPRRARGPTPKPTGLYRSDDGGATWRKVNNANPRPMYFSQVRIDPNDPEVVYLGGVGLHQTLDGGRTIATDVAASTHDDVHAIWINPANSDHVLIGNDGGLARVVRQGARSGCSCPTCRSGSSTTSASTCRRRTTSAAACRTTTTGAARAQVRGAAGIANYPLVRRSRAATASSCCRIRRTTAIVFSESQDGNIVRVDRVTGETMGVRPLAGARRAGAALVTGIRR